MSESGANEVSARSFDASTIRYPADLPITARHDDLLATIRDHQVVIVAGETGSGKSTQLPKICLELGRGVDGLIGHTQPRRVAARTIAERVAEELGTELGTTVGYTVRFTDRVGEQTMVKVMTDGILLAEIRRDPLLRRYDTLIIDEAHERSLNIDFLLGYLRQLLQRRPDLKLIVTSATIDTARFAAHFADPGGTPASIIEVSGRSYPVELRYRPYGTGDLAAGVSDRGGGGKDDRDQVQAICDAVDELAGAGPGDVLVFVSGEREIHDTADALRRLDRRGAQAFEVLPLYARLSAAEQHRIFQAHTGRRIVLSTNVAETSLTVPGVRYVIDAGTARISRYSLRLKVQRLPIEPVSQASANQRAGRCGRVAPGICIRLYDESDFLARPEFTEPEILRTNLASVILQMTSLGLGDVAAFPFLDPPDARAVRDGVMLLEELGALNPGQPADQRRLTPLGKRLAQLPVDPRLGRMVLEADRHGCLREVMIVVAALSIQDVRERPSDKQQAADESHRRFRVEGSDFLSIIKLWDHLREQQKELGSSQFRKMCRSEYLNYLRVREWQDLFSQLRQAAGAVGIRLGSEVGHPDRVHQALLAGLLSHIGMRDGTGREYRGARGSKFMIANGSAAGKKPPKWVMAGELVETNRLWARNVAAIQPEWAERLAPHLITRSYSEPVWDSQRGAAMTTERVSLFGLPLVAGRRVGYDRLNPVAAREMFIHSALVAGEWTTHHPFFAENQAVIDEVNRLAERTRRGDLVDEARIFAFYDQRIGAEVVSTRHFDQWWKQARRDRPDLLRLTVDALTSAGASSLDPDDWPETWHQGDLALAITYLFQPGEPGDGVTVHIPLAVLNRVRDEGFDWQVPGLRTRVIDELVRTLPKPLRRALSPLAATVAAAASRIRPADGPLALALARALTEIGGQHVPAAAVDVTRLPDHLRVRFSVDDDEGKPVAVGTDLEALRRLLARPLREAVATASAASGIERTGVTSWDFGTLPSTIESVRGGHTVLGYPALLDDGDSVSIRVFTNADIQARAMRSGVRRLLLLTAAPSVKQLERRLANSAKLAIAASGSSPAELIGDCLLAAADRYVVDHGGAAWDAEDFAELVKIARAGISDATTDAMHTAAEIVALAGRVSAVLDRLVTAPMQPAVEDMRAQLARLVRPGFVSATGIDRLTDVLRYVRGIERRAEKLPSDLVRDRQRMIEVLALEGRYRALLAGLPRGRTSQEVIDAGWMLEELRVGLFAQSLGTARPISAQRIARVLDELERR